MWDVVYYNDKVLSATRSSFRGPGRAGQMSLFTLTGESMSVGYIDTSAGLEEGGAGELGHMVAHCSLYSKRSLQNQSFTHRCS